MKKLAGFIITITLLLTACTPVVSWSQTNVSDEKSLADLSSCETQARQATARPQPVPIPVFGDGKVPSADKALVNDLIDFFSNQVNLLEQRNTDLTLDIGFGASELSLLRDELERNFAGEIIYERSDESLEIKDTFLRVLGVLRTTPQVNLLELWEQTDKENPFSFGEEITTESASTEALAKYDASISTYLNELEEPLQEQYQAELSGKVAQCMQGLGYQPRE
jgi:hypothetical protein